MKLKNSNLLLIFAMAFSIILVSCSGDDNGGGDPPAQATCSDGIQNGTETGIDCGGSCSACAVAEEVNLTGSQTEDRTLDPTKEYKITGTFSIEAGRNPYHSCRNRYRFRRGHR